MSGRIPIHGHARRANKTPEWRAWAAMRGRCLNTTAHNAHRYNGRGIKVCERWNDFANFLADMGNKPTRFHSIDRIDNDGDYEPSNCRWATKNEQACNSSNARLVTIDGVTRCISEWLAESGIKRVTYKMRMRAGWDITRAITQPPVARSFK